MHEDIEEKITLPEEIQVSVNSELTIKGPKGELKREFPCEIKVAGNELKISAKNATKKEKKLIKTSIAHINNMIKGVMEGYTYKMLVCSVHFPMNVKIEKDQLIIKNFMGESKERKAKILPNVEAKVQGEFVVLSSIDKEAAGQTAAGIEAATRVRNKDRRVFQDGIWLIEKPGKKILE